MTEKKKKPEAKKASSTQRYSDVAKELGIEVKALLALADQFVEAHPDFKELVYLEGKKPAASSNFSKFFRDDFLALMDTDAVIGYKISLALARHIGQRLRDGLRRHALSAGARGDDQ